MKPRSRLLPAGITLAIFGVVLALVAWPIGQPGGSDELQAQAQANLEKIWPMFGGTASRNMINTFEKNVPDDFSIERKDFKGKLISPAKNVKWTAALGSRAYGGPVVVGGKIFVGTNNHYPRNPKVKGDKGVLMCFRESDGQFLWQLISDKLPGGQVVDWPHEGVCSTPIVEGNRLYYVSNRCEVVCLDTEGFANGNDGVQDEKYQDKTDGDVIWRYDMMKEVNVFPHNMAACSPMIVGDIIYIVTANGVDEGHINIPSPNAPSFIALDKKSGKLVWQDNSPGKMIMHGQWSNPTYAVAQVDGKDQPQVVFPGGDGWLYAFEPAKGKLLWKFDANPKDSKYELGGMGTRSDFIGTPVVVGNLLYIGTGQDPEHYEGIGHLWCIDINRASAKGGDVSPDLVTDAKADPVKFKPNPNSAVVWHYGGPYSKEDAAKFGRDYPFGRTMSTVAVHDGLVYAGELAGFLHCLDAKTGKHLWQHDLKAAVWGSAFWVDGKVYIATEDGDVWIFQHGAQKKEPKKVEFGQPIRSTPVVAGGVLYVMSESHLFAIGK